MTYSGRVSAFADSAAVILAFGVATAVSFVALVVGGDGVRQAVAVSLQIVYVPTWLVESACVCVGGGGGGGGGVNVNTVLVQTVA